MPLLLGALALATGCGSAPRERPGTPERHVSEAPPPAERPELTADVDDPAWPRLAEEEIRAAFARASTSTFRVECRQERCRVQLDTDITGEVESALALPDCAVRRLAGSAYLVDCWGDGSAEWPERTRSVLEARLARWSDETAMHARIRSLHCENGGCRLELGWTDRAAVRSDERGDVEVTERMLGGLHGRCGGTFHGIDAAPDGAGLIRVIDIDCRQGDGGWSTEPSEYEERANEEAVLADVREEPRDAAWADVTEHAITERVNQWLAPSVTLTKVECADGRCRVDATWEGGRVRRSIFELRRGVFSIEGCEVRNLERAEADAPGLSLAVDCAWPNGRRPPDWARRTEAELRRQFEAFVQELRTRASIHRVECRTSRCIVQIETHGHGREGSHELARSLRDVGGCSSHGGGHTGGYDYFLFSCVR